MVDIWEGGVCVVCVLCCFVDVWCFFVWYVVGLIIVFGMVGVIVFCYM